MKLLSFFQICIVLSDSFVGKFLHEVDELRLLDVLLLELLDLEGVSGREEHHLLVPGHDLDDPGHDLLEVQREQLVYLVQH